jgi:carbon monoxide dehydrogenase subunit G
MNVEIEIERSVTVPVAYAQAQALLHDVENTIRLFPKLRKLTRQKDGSYLWELAPIGSKVANISHEVSFAAKFVVDPQEGLVEWKPVKGQGKNQGRNPGNARIEGRLQLRPHGQATAMSLRVNGDLYDVPVPLMFRLVAPPFIQGKFAALVERYFLKLGESLGLPDEVIRGLA